MLRFLVVALCLVMMLHVVKQDNIREDRAMEQNIKTMSMEGCRGALIMAHPKINWENPHLLERDPKLSRAMRMFERESAASFTRGQCLDAMNNFNDRLYN